VQHRWTRISIGPFVSPSPLAGDQAARALVTLLRLGGIADAEYYAPQDMQLLRWHKLSINATFSPLSILAGGLRTADFLAIPAFRELARQCLHEVHATATTLHQRPFPEGWASVEAILESSARNPGKPSMLLDWEAGRELELAVILRNPIAMAQERAMRMPRLHTFLCLLEGLRQQQQQQRVAKL
jgi:2-dehydropantoate 2-reductase